MIFTKEQAEAFESFTWNAAKETREAYKELVALITDLKERNIGGELSDTRTIKRTNG